MGVKLIEMTYEEIVAHKEKSPFQIMSECNLGNGSRKIPAHYSDEVMYEDKK